MIKTWKWDATRGIKPCHVCFTESGAREQNVSMDGGSATRPLSRDGAWSNSMETQQSGHAPRSGQEVKSGSNAKDGPAECLRCETTQKEVS